MADDDPRTLSAVAIGTSAAMSAGASVMGGTQQQSAANAQAQQYKQQSQLALLSSGSKIGAEDYSANRAIEAGAASRGASGLTAQSSTAVLNEAASEQKIKDMYTRFSGEYASTQDLYAAKTAKWEGKQAMIGGLFGAAKNLLGGATGIGQTEGWIAPTP